VKACNVTTPLKPTTPTSGRAKPDA
jgi:hypothetical protein